jgi:hypothetical protein
MAVAEFFNEQAKRLLDTASRCPEVKMAEAMRTMVNTFLGLTRKPMGLLPGLAIVLAFAGVLSTPVHAQHYPSKPIKIIVPVAAGGSTDVVARIVAEYLTRKTGQPVIVVNRTGAAGVIGADAIAKAPSDGYTLGLNATSQIVLNPFLQKNMPLNPLEDLVPIAPIAEAPQILVIDSRLRARTLEELIRYSRQIRTSSNMFPLALAARRTWAGRNSPTWPRLTSLRCNIAVLHPGLRT